MTFWLICLILLNFSFTKLFASPLHTTSKAAKVLRQIPLDQQPSFPDPLNFNVKVEDHIDHIINKRQTTTEFANLLDSFGGPNPDEIEIVTDPPLQIKPLNPRSGAYFLIDWNTFLDVDDQNGRRVNLRFQPKIGDPKRFFSVK